MQEQLLEQLQYCLEQKSCQAILFFLADDAAHGIVGHEALLRAVTCSHTCSSMSSFNHAIIKSKQQSQNQSSCIPSILAFQ